MKPVEISQRAEQDFLEIYRYISADRPEAAEHLGDRIDSIISLLAENSQLGRVRPDPGLNLRYIPEGNYLVFYRDYTDRIVILRILHASRNLRRIWRQRD